MKVFTGYNFQPILHYKLFTEEIITMAKFKCLECKKEFEIDSHSQSRRCPECMSRYLELVSGEIPRGKSWSSKTFSAR